MKTVAYLEEYGEIRFPEGFAEKLAGKTPEEQMEYYRITENCTYARTAYGEPLSERAFDSLCRLDEFKLCTALIVKEGLVVGVMIRDWYYADCEHSCLPYESVCTYSASDNEGSGTKEREDYAWLICL